jgi:spectinomycin phosphotransferase
MTVESSAISPSALASHVRSKYGLSITTLGFTPKGEDADAYRATASGGEQYFVRVQRGTEDVRQEATYAALEMLRADCAMPAIVAPLRTTQGCFISRLEQYAVAVFPFIDGTTAFDTTLSETQWRQLAAIMAALHISGDRCVVPALPHETFANPFAVPIDRVMQRATSTFAPTSSEQAQVLALLREQRADLERTLPRFDHLGKQARRLALPKVPTHGDPNLANVLIDHTGSLHLVDWGELALAPRERDLTFFTGERFAAWLEAYLEHTGRVRLHLELFTFYLYRWVLQEIACYTSRILLEPSEGLELAHAWQELQPYLPIPHASIAMGVDAVHQTLIPFVTAGRVDVSTTNA